MFTGAVDINSVTFVSSGGTVAWGGSGTLGATLAGFAHGGTLDLTALAYASGGSATLSGLVLSVKEGGKTDRIAFASRTEFSDTHFTLGRTAQGGTAVTLTLVSAAALLPVHSGG